MLKEREIPFTYREYRTEPLSTGELRDLFDALGLEPKDLLRTRDPVFTALGLTGDESADELIRHMAAHPTLLQRPIGIRGGRAVVGRPVEQLLTLVE